MRPLMLHQKKAFQYLLQHNLFALFMKMRLGKTLVTIRFLRRHPGRLLIVAPNEALISWELELDKESEPFIRLAGSRKDRQELLEKPSRYYLINKEGFLALPELNAVKWKAVILDESTFIKSPRTKVTDYFTKNFRAVPIRGILTGTPNPEGPLDYICQLNFVDPDILKMSYWQFRMKLCRCFGHEWWVTKAGRKILGQAVADNCFSLTREEVGIKDRKVYIQRRIEFPKALAKVRKTIRDEYILEHGSVLEKTNLAITTFGWERKLSAGYVADKRVWNGKFKVVLDLLKTELKSQPVVIWTNYRKCENEDLFHYLQKHRIRKSAYINGGVSGEDRKKIIQRFQDGKLDVLVIQTSCGTYGLNLSRADTAIYLSCPLGALKREQSEDRIVSLSKKRTLLYIDIVVKKSIDVHVLKGNKSKLSKQQILDSYIKQLKSKESK